MRLLRIPLYDPTALDRTERRRTFLEAYRHDCALSSE